MNITDLKKYLHSRKEDPQNPTGNVLGLEARLHTDNMTFFMHFFHTFSSYAFSETGQEKKGTMPDHLKTPTRVNAFTVA